MTLANAQQLSIRADYWFPMNGNPDSERPGYMIELAKVIFEPQGITVDYQLMPWRRAVELTREGENDCVVGAYKADARDFVFPEMSWGKDSPRFYVGKNDSWRFTGELSSLESRRIGMISGYLYEPSFDAFAQKNAGLMFQFMSGNDALDKNIFKFKARRIDTLLESKKVMEAKLMQLGEQGLLVSAGLVVEPTDMYLACSPNKASSERYIEMVNKTMPELKRSGVLDQILNRYGLQSW
ncbi:substrate-binding periplasmic protein [Bermanella sp. R86510]|uniref:substrate-binding periplasmic protein n=1 Tax=unclassified Bermanella TaxID=2627862 RepID=UPI0037C5EDCC